MLRVKKVKRTHLYLTNQTPHADREQKRVKKHFLQ